jgi:hypothetical protein
MTFEDIWRPVTGLLGLGLCLAPVLLYRDEERKLQNRLVDWWVRVTEMGEGKASKQSAFARALAHQSLGVLEFIFGPRPLSLRVVLVSAVLSQAGIYLVLFAVVASFLLAAKLGFLPAPAIDKIRETPSGWGKDFAAHGVPLFVGPLFFGFWERRNTKALSTITGSVMVWGSLACLCYGLQQAYALTLLFVKTSKGTPYHFGLSVLWIGVMVFSLASDVIALSISRWVLLKVEQARTWAVHLMSALVAIPVLILGVPIAIAISVISRTADLDTTRVPGQLSSMSDVHLGARVFAGGAIFLITAMNMVDVLLSLGLILVSVFLALNAIAWGSLSRLLNAAFERSPSRSQVFAAGVLLLGLSWAPSFTGYFRHLVGADQTADKGSSTSK